MFFFSCQVLEEFYNIFGPELKAVTGDPKRIEDVLVRVGQLVEPIEQVNLLIISLRWSGEYLTWRGALVAQLVERLTCNWKVVDSNLGLEGPCGTYFQSFCSVCQHSIIDETERGGPESISLRNLLV